MNGYGRGEDNTGGARSSVITRETFGMTLLLFSVVLLVISIIGSYIFGEIGVAITAFILGVFGFFTYPFLIFCIGLSISMISGKKLASWRWVARAAFLVCSVFLIAHLATSVSMLGGGFNSYMEGCWSAASASASGSTAGGVLFGLIVYPAATLLSNVGAYILFSALTAAALFLCLRATPLKKMFARSSRAPKERKEKKQKPAASFDDLAAPTARTMSRSYDYAEPPASPAPRAGAQEAQPAPQPYDRPYAQSSQQPYAPQPYDRPVPQPTQQPYQQPISYAQDAQQFYPPQREPDRGERYGYDYGRYRPYEETAASETPLSERSAHDILFSSDPATSYRTNLAYNRDSDFNNRVRRSSILPNKSAPQTSSYVSRSYQPVQQQAPAAPTYSDSFEDRVRVPRDNMPRKIVEQRPQPVSSGYTVRAEDLNYPQAPSYRATDVPLSRPARDEYANDVPYEEEFSSAPNIDDIPDAEEEKQPGLRRAPLEPMPEPLKSDRETAEPAPEGEGAPRGEEDPRDRFRNAFSRPSASAGRIDFDLSNLEDRLGDSLDGDRSRFERQKQPSARFEASEERFDRFSEDRYAGNFDDAGDSRAFDALDAGREIRGRGRRGERSESSDADLFDRDDTAEDFGIPAAPAPKPKKHVYKPYCPPSLALLQQYDDTVTVGPEEIEHNSNIIVETLAGFKVDTEIMKVTPGPSVTRYDIDIPRNITVGTVTKRDAEIAMRLHARDGVNMYSNNETGFVAIEVPNAHRAKVGLRSVMQSEDFRRSKPGALTFAIGKDVEGRNVCGNIAKMKHILVAGATGSGKSVCLNAMLISLICKYSPEDLRLILIDPKKVEFTIYDGLPHLMINEIIADAQKAVTALNWAIKEMERRYELFEQKTRSGIVVRDLDEYNENLIEDEQKLPKIVIVVDELADLMSVAKKEIEERIQRLTQKARAAGIHLVIATQRPSVDVITGVIKGNLPTRMAFRVISEVDSRTILDESGAEKLLGNGDMLFRTEGMFNCCRVQGALIGSQEVQAIVEDIKVHNEAYFDPDVVDYINHTEPEDGDFEEGGEQDGSVDPMYIRALAKCVQLGQASISLVQRKCSVGYNHAGKIIEWMEMMGYISPFDGKAKARAVLLTKEEYESKYGPLE